MAPKKPLLTKSPKPNPDAACRVPKREPAYYPKNSAQAEFWSFCAFAERNAVSLAKTDCKGALAPKKPFLIKNREPKPRIQLTLNSVIRMPISNKEGMAYGGPGALWHLKSRYLPKAPESERRHQIRKAWHRGPGGSFGT